MKAYLFHAQDVLPELAGTDFPEEITLLSLATHTSGLNTDPPGFYDTPLEKCALIRCNDCNTCCIPSGIADLSRNRSALAPLCCKLKRKKRRITEHANPVGDGPQHSKELGQHRATPTRATAPEAPILTVNTHLDPKRQSSFIQYVKLIQGLATARRGS